MLKVQTQWVKQNYKHKDNAFLGKGNLRPEDDEIRKLKLKIADLEEENEILKKGSSHLHKATEVIFKFIYDHRFKFRVQKMFQFELIELFYNTEKLHSILNYKSPKDYENERKDA